jgi:carboxylesterase type B
MLASTFLTSCFLTAISAIPTSNQQRPGVFTGIPYATVPERFAAPGAPDAKVFSDRNTLAPSCFERQPANVEREGCLFLNVFTPSGQVPASTGLGSNGGPVAKSDKAVLVWLGDTATSENLTSSAYDGGSLALAQDVIVVVPNYRQDSLSLSDSISIIEY